jgi:hypothetical protein
MERRNGYIRKGLDASREDEYSRERVIMMYADVVIAKATRLRKGTIPNFRIASLKPFPVSAQETRST